MFTPRYSLAVVLVASLALRAGAADPPPAAPPSKEQIAKWVKQLGADDFEAREEASRKLWEAGQAAEEALNTASKDDDTEIRRRSGELLDKFKWGIYPDTPKALVDLIAKYQAGDSSARMELLRPFLDFGVPGCRVLLKITSAEPDPTVRTLLAANLLGRELPRVMPLLLKEQQFALVEQFLDIALDSDFDIAINHYVAYWRLRGRLDERIARHTKLEGKENKRQAEILTYLQRAKGDAPAALAAARRSGNDKLIDGMLFEMGSWKELANRGNAIDGDSRAELLGHRATFHRLAGNAADAKENYAEMRRYAATLPIRPIPIGGIDSQAITIAKTFFVNDMPDDALEVLKASGSWVMAYEILIARFRFAEADALVEKVRTDVATAKTNPDLVRDPDSDVLDRLLIMQARTWCLLGDKAKGLPVFARYAEKIKDNLNMIWVDELIDAEVRADLTDQAFDHAAKALALEKVGDFWSTRLLRRLFPRQKETALTLYQFMLTGKGAPDPATALKRLRALLGGKTPQKEVIAFLDATGPVLDARKKALPEALDSRFPTRDEAIDPEACWKALAEVALLAGLEERSRTCLEKADSADSLVELGDRLAAKKQWETAARWYQKAWDKERQQPLALYLYGHALVQAGRDKEGREAMLQAHWLPLGDESSRNSFAIELMKRGQTRDGQRENDLILHIGDIAGGDSAEAMRRNGLEALTRKEYLVFAEAQERAMLRVLRSTTNFLQTSGYISAPSSIHRYRAAGLVKAGKAAEAVKEAERALTLMPSDLDAAILVVPELDALGKKEEAAQLYRRSRAAYEQLCKDFPRSTLGHNGVAWLAACCHRDLDDALVHAQKAVELAPDNASHLDTLAEVCFQLGQKDRAIEAQKKAVALSPKRSYYRKQLQRFEAGDPKAQRPDENALDDDDD